MLSSRPDAQAIKVLIIEGGYANELRYRDKMRHKMEQHQKLSLACKILPKVLGITGGVFHSNIDSMRQAGISITTLRHLSKHSREYMQTIIDLRRRLEKPSPHNTSLQGTRMCPGGFALMHKPRA